MSDQQHRAPEFSGLEQSWEQMNRIVAERDDLRARLEESEARAQNFERQATLLMADNERLHRHNHHMRDELNHHFRNAADADATLAAMGALLVDRKRQREDHAGRVDRRRQSTQPGQHRQEPQRGSPQRAEDEQRMPSVAQRGPRPLEETAPAKSAFRIDLPRFLDRISDIGRGASGDRAELAPA